MKILRYIAVIVAVTAGALGWHAAPAAAATAGDSIDLVTTTLPKFLPGQTAWVSLVLTGGNVDACNVKMTGTSPFGGISASYPSNNAFTSAYRDNTLSAGEIDYFAIKITADADDLISQLVTLSLTYNDCTGAKAAHTYPLLSLLPITLPTGPLFTQTTTSVSVPVNTAKWVDVAYLGQSPKLTNFAVKVTDAAGAKITYPGNNTVTKPVSGTALPVGTPDTVALNIDTTGLKPGTYTLKLQTSYGSPSTTGSGSLTLIVS